MLPIELSGFRAFVENKAVVLVWETASETDNKGFEVQRSSDWANWESIGWVDGHGSTVVAHKYHFKDNSAMPGNNYYRLKQVDLSGAAVFSPVRQVEFHAGRLSLSIVPNPNRGAFAFHLDVSENVDFQLSITDLNGRILWQREGAGEGGIIQFSSVEGISLPPGLYIVRASTADGQSLLKRMAIQ